MSRTLSIVAVQTAPVAWDPAATWAAFEADLRARRAARPTAQLFLYPELHLSAHGRTGIPRPRSWTLTRLAEPVRGPRTERLGLLARELGIWLVPGSIYERGEGNDVYNTTVAFAPDGTLRATYRKVFPWRPYESVKAGRDFTAFDLDGVGRAGLMICYDGWFPEVARQLTWLGAEVILQPTLTDTADREQELVLARANAIVNQAYVVNVNAGGELGVGGSLIVDPEGHVIAQAGTGEAELTAVLDLDAVTRARELGTAGLDRLLHQIDTDTAGLQLPAYGGSFQPRSGRPTPPR
jgi:formamidase